MKSYNQSFADHFNEIADLLAITGGGFFQVRAYREAARRLKEETGPITKKNANLKYFKSLPKIGEALALKMMQLVETGKMDYLEELRAQVPEGVRDMLKIPTLGPKRIGMLYLTAGIKSKAELIAKAKSGELEELPGLGKKSVEKILESIGRDQEKKKRHQREQVEPFAQEILTALKKIDLIKTAEVAGSYRRKAPTVGDLDILAVTHSKSSKGNLLNQSEPIQVIQQAILHLFPGNVILGSGETKLSFMIFPQNLQVDIRFVPEESYGAALLYFTGNKDFNVKMRRVAIEKSCLLNEYGLMKQGKIIAGRSEGEVFKALGMEYVPPEKRK